MPDSLEDLETSTFVSELDMRLEVFGGVDFGSAGFGSGDSLVVSALGVG